MSDSSSHPKVSRRKALAGIGAAGFALSEGASHARAANRLNQDDAAPARHRRSSLSQCRNASVAYGRARRCIHRNGRVVGFYAPGDGGGALYCVRKIDDDTQANDADFLELKDGLAAVLVWNEAVNYRMFGAVGDGQDDDGIQIKKAHQFANKHDLPVIQLSGEFWISRTTTFQSRPTSPGAKRFFMLTSDTTANTIRALSS